MPHPKQLALVALLLLLAAPAARGQAIEDYDYENLALSGVSAHLGWVFPTRTDPALMLNLRVDLGLLGPNLRIAPGIGYWSSRLRGSEVRRIEERIEAACERGGVPCPGIDLGTVEISDLWFDVDAHYLWTTDYFVEPYAGAGVSLHLLNGRGDFIDDTFVEELLDAISPGLNLVGGLEMPLAANLRVIGEVRGVLTGSVRFAGLTVGGAWRFPPELQRPVLPPPPPPPPGVR
jgi:opacity protein-like surface antigen